MKLERSGLRPKKSVTLRRPHFHVVNPSATTHTIINKNGEVSLSSSEMLEGNDIRKLNIASKYQAETFETCVPKQRDVEVLSTSDEMLEGNDIRSLKTATKCHNEAAET